MKNYTWIRQAIAAGGKMEVSGIIRGNGILRAQMSWSGEETIVGAISMTIDGALDNLESDLAADAAKEHLKTSGL